MVSVEAAGKSLNSLRAPGFPIQATLINGRAGGGVGNRAVANSSRKL